MEIFLEDDGSLVASEVWKARISGIKSVSGKEVSNKEEAVEIVEKRIVEAVKKRVPNGKFGIMFSGGVDSSLIAFICRKSGLDFTCYSAGFELSSRDLDSAKKAADLIDVRLKYEAFSLDGIAHFFHVLKGVIPDPNVVSLGVGAVVYSCALMAKKDGVSCLFSGLGSEEIFAGYQRHEQASEINAECWKGLFGMRERDLVRDYSISKFSGVSFLAPFLDEDLIGDCIRISGDLKIGDLGKKSILRHAAIKMGLPGSIALRNKLAAQYGSGFDLAMEKLAKRGGFQGKQKYVSSLL